MKSNCNLGNTKTSKHFGSSNYQLTIYDTSFAVANVLDNGNTKKVFNNDDFEGKIPLQKPKNGKKLSRRIISKGKECNVTVSSLERDKETKLAGSTNTNTGNTEQIQRINSLNSQTKLNKEANSSSDQRENSNSVIRKVNSNERPENLEKHVHMVKNHEHKDAVYKVTEKFIKLRPINSSSVKIKNKDFNNNNTTSKISFCGLVSGRKIDKTKPKIALTENRVNSEVVMRRKSVSLIKYSNSKILSKIPIFTCNNRTNDNWNNKKSETQTDLIRNGMHTSFLNRNRTNSYASIPLNCIIGDTIKKQLAMFSVLANSTTDKTYFKRKQNSTNKENIEDIHGSLRLPAVSSQNILVQKQNKFVEKRDTNTKCLELQGTCVPKLFTSKIPRTTSSLLVRPEAKLKKNVALINNVNSEACERKFVSKIPISVNSTMSIPNDNGNSKSEKFKKLTESEAVLDLEKSIFNRILNYQVMFIPDIFPKYNDTNASQQKSEMKTNEIMDKCKRIDLERKQSLENIFKKKIHLCCGDKLKSCGKMPSHYQSPKRSIAKDVSCPALSQVNKISKLKRSSNLKLYDAPPKVVGLKSIVSSPETRTPKELVSCKIRKVNYRRIIKGVVENKEEKISKASLNQLNHNYKNDLKTLKNVQTNSKHIRDSKKYKSTFHVEKKIEEIFQDDKSNQTKIDTNDMEVQIDLPEKDVNNLLLENDLHCISEISSSERSLGNHPHIKDKVLQDDHCSLYYKRQNCVTRIKPFDHFDAILKYCIAILEAKINMEQVFVQCSEIKSKRPIEIGCQVDNFPSIDSFSQTSCCTINKSCQCCRERQSKMSISSKLRKDHVCKHFMKKSLESARINANEVKLFTNISKTLTHPNKMQSKQMLFLTISPHAPGFDRKITGRKMSCYCKETPVDQRGKIDQDRPKNLFEEEDDDNEYSEIYMKQLVDSIELENETKRCSSVPSLPDVVVATDRCESKMEIPWLKISLAPPGYYEIKNMEGRPKQVVCDCWNLSTSDDIYSELLVDEEDKPECKCTSKKDVQFENDKPIGEHVSVEASATISVRASTHVENKFGRISGNASSNIRNEKSGRISENVSSNIGQDNSTRIIARATQNPSGNIASEKSGKLSQHVSSNIGNEKSGRISEKVSGNVENEKSKVLSQNASGNVGTEKSGRISEHVSGNIASEKSGRISEKVSGNIENEKSKVLSQNASGNVGSEKSGRISEHVSGNIASEKSGRISEHASGNIPSEKSGGISEHVSGNIPSEKSGRISEHVSGNIASEKSGGISEHVSGNIPSEKSGRISEHASGNVPSEKSGRISEHASGNIGNEKSGKLSQSVSVNTGNERSGRISENVSGNIEKGKSGRIGENVSTNVEKEKSINFEQRSKIPVSTKSSEVNRGIDKKISEKSYEEIIIDYDQETISCSISSASSSGSIPSTCICVPPKNECDGILGKPTAFVFDNPCFGQHEAYLDPIYRLFPDDCDTYCGPHIEMPWSDLTIPRKIKLRQAKRSAEEKKCKCEPVKEEEKVVCGSKDQAVVPASSEIASSTRFENSKNKVDKSFEIQLSFTEIISNMAALENKSTVPSGLSVSIKPASKEKGSFVETRSPTSNYSCRCESPKSKQVSTSPKKPRSPKCKNPNCRSPSRDTSSAKVESNTSYGNKCRNPNCKFSSPNNRSPRKISEISSSPRRGRYQDPVMNVLETCEAEMEPLRDTLNQLKSKIRNLNIPELNNWSGNSMQCPPCSINGPMNIPAIKPPSPTMGRPPMPSTNSQNFYPMSVPPQFPFPSMLPPMPPPPVPPRNCCPQCCCKEVRPRRRNRRSVSSSTDYSEYDSLSDGESLCPFLRALSSKNVNKESRTQRKCKNQGTQKRSSRHRIKNSTKCGPNKCNKRTSANTLHQGSYTDTEPEIQVHYGPKNPRVKTKQVFKGIVDPNLPMAKNQRFRIAVKVTPSEQNLPDDNMLAIQGPCDYI